MVLDRGGHFNPAGIVGSHTLSFLLSPRTAHDRAVGNTREHKPRQRDVDRDTNNVSIVTYPNQGGINSIPL